jgi:hypothetical protein
MTTVQRVAQLFGVVFLLIGIIGFFYARTMEMQMLLGIFPVNLLHNTVHIVFGLWGIAASRSFGGAKAYGQIGGVIYLVLAVLGYFDPTGFGLVPLGGNDIWLHTVLGIVLAYFGFMARGGATSAEAGLS